MTMQNDYLKKIEFITIYPNEEGSKTLLGTAITSEGYRALLYAPAVEALELGMNSTDGYDEIYDARHVPIARIPHTRLLKIEGTAYCIKNRHNENEDWFMKVIYLDGPASKTHIKKSELEKILGCVIDG